MAPSNSKKAEQIQLAKANIRLAWVLGSIVLLSLFATFYFWPKPQLPS